jgi:predicted nuclease of predicted toxin-antitoxin system
MKVLLDNNLPKYISEIFKNWEVLIVKDVLGADAKDLDILSWSIKNNIDLFFTKDKQFSLIIANLNINLKCVLCVFGNLSIKNTLEVFKNKKTEIEYFSKSNFKILKI